MVYCEVVIPAAGDPRGGGWTDGDAAGDLGSSMWGRDPSRGWWNCWTRYRRTDGDAARDPRGGGWNEGTWDAVD